MLFQAVFAYFEFFQISRKRGKVHCKLTADLSKVVWYLLQLFLHYVLKQKHVNIMIGNKTVKLLNILLLNILAHNTLSVIGLPLDYHVNIVSIDIDPQKFRIFFQPCIASVDNWRGEYLCSQTLKTKDFKRN